MARFRPAVIGCAFLLVAACGGTTKQSIRRPTALQLAKTSDAVASALTAGDACQAQARARTLRSQVAAAVAAGLIPPPLAPDARAASTRLVSAIACTPPPPTPPATSSGPGPPPPAPRCNELDARKNALEQGNQNENGNGGERRHRENHQDEHALDRQRKECR